MNKKEKISLSDIPKKDVFKTPPDYFDSLGNRIDQKIFSTKGKHVYLSPRYFSIAAAAMIALAILAIAFFITRNSSPSTIDLLADISAEDCMLYLQRSDIDAADILSIIETEGLFEESDAFISSPDITDSDLDILYDRYGATEDYHQKQF